MRPGTYICLDCHNEFVSPEQTADARGFIDEPYESWWGCPYCGGPYAKAVVCDHCEQLITSQYIETADGEELCEHCFTVHDIGE